MLNAILKKLNGSGDDPSAIEAVLLQIGRERTAARAELTELQVRRHQALLDDAEDAAISKFDLLVERKEVQIEKLDLAEPGVRQKLAAAQALARQQRLRKLQGDYAAAAAAFISSARKTVAAHAALVAIAEAGRLSGLERELATLAVAPNIGGNAICAPDLLDLFESALAGPPPAPVRAAAASTGPRPAPHQRSQITDSQHGVSLALDGPARRPRPIAPDDDGALAAGEVRAVVIRAGFTTPAGASCRVGQKIRLPGDVAVAAMKNGAIEILEQAPMAPAASNLEASP